jgi:hypothetical protein
VGERLTGAHNFSRGVHVEVLNPPGHPRVHVRDGRFVRHDRRHGTHRLGQRCAPDRLEANVDRPCRCRLDRDTIVGCISASRRFHACHALDLRGRGRDVERPAAAGVLHPQRGDEHERGGKRRYQRCTDSTKSARSG